MRRSIPVTIPMIDPELAARRHRDGMSCVNPGIYTYDANGHKRWCADCKAPLGEQSWAEDGVDVPGWAIGACICALGFVLLLVAFMITQTGRQVERGGQRPAAVTPSPYPAPPVVVD